MGYRYPDDDLDVEAEEADDDAYFWRSGDLPMGLSTTGGSICVGGEAMLNVSRKFVVSILRSAIRHAREVCERREHSPTRTERTGIFANSLRQAWKEALDDACAPTKHELDLLSLSFFRGETWWDIGVLSPRGMGVYYAGSRGSVNRKDLEDWLVEALASDEEEDVQAVLQELRGMLEVAGRRVELSNRSNDRTEDVLKDMGEALAPISQL